MRARSTARVESTSKVYDSSSPKTGIRDPGPPHSIASVPAVPDARPKENPVRSCHPRRRPATAASSRASS